MATDLRPFTCNPAPFKIEHGARFEFERLDGTYKVISTPEEWAAYWGVPLECGRAAFAHFDSRFVRVFHIEEARGETNEEQLLRLRRLLVGKGGE